MKSIPCVCCGVQIVPAYFDEEDLTQDNVDRFSYLNGMACNISYGYGCALDGDMYIIGLCENCTQEKVAENKLVYTGNYIP